jgi:hypothetical protein
MQTKLSTALEIISAVAVVLSLVFVGLEIRNGNEQTQQNTRALRVSAYQDLISRIVDVNTLAIEESVTIESLIMIESPSENQVEKLNSFLWILFRHGDMAYFQYENGSISEERMLSAMTPLLGRLRYPKVVTRWNNIKQAFVPAYRSFIDKRIESLSVAEGSR